MLFISIQACFNTALTCPNNHNIMQFKCKAKIKLTSNFSPNPFITENPWFQATKSCLKHIQTSYIFTYTYGTEVHSLSRAKALIFPSWKSRQQALKAELKLQSSSTSSRTPTLWNSGLNFLNWDGIMITKAQGRDVYLSFYASTEHFRENELCSHI